MIELSSIKPWFKWYIANKVQITQVSSEWNLDSFFFKGFYPIFDISQDNFVMAESDILEVTQRMALLLDKLEGFFCEIIVAEVKSAYFFTVLY